MASNRGNHNKKKKKKKKKNTKTRITTAPRTSAPRARSKFTCEYSDTDSAARSAIRPARPPMAPLPFPHPRSAAALQRTYDSAAILVLAEFQPVTNKMGSRMQTRLSERKQRSLISSSPTWSAS